MRSVVLSFVFFAFLLAGYSQTPQKTNVVDSLFNSGITFNLSPDGKSKIGFKYAMQFWARHARTNPGTLGFNGEPIDWFSDMVMRRNRLRIYTLLDDKVFFYTQFGSNSERFDGGGESIFFHDLNVMYALSGKKLRVGAGLSNWMGISRYTNVSFQFNYVHDHPTFNYPNIGRTDLAARIIGTWVTGQVGKLGYRMNFGKPFYFDNFSAIENDSIVNTAGEYGSESFSFSGYFTWSFLDTEESWFPFYHMTRLGAKKIITLGAGFHYHPNSIAYMDENFNRQVQERLQLGIDMMIDYPLTDGSLINLYAVYYNYDMGPNFLRSTTGVDGHQLAPEFAADYPQGGGLSQFTIGTGQIIHTQFGYLLPITLGERGKLMPFGTYTFHDFEGLGDNLQRFDAGLTYFIHGHNVKLTFEYQTRPVYSGTTGPDALGEQELLKGMYLMQVHFMI
jgi:hypothetical protein